MRPKLSLGVALGLLVLAVAWIWNHPSDKGGVVVQGGLAFSVVRRDGKSYLMVRVDPAPDPDADPQTVLRVAFQTEEIAIVEKGTQRWWLDGTEIPENFFQDKRGLLSRDCLVVLSPGVSVMLEFRAPWGSTLVVEPTNVFDAEFEAQLRKRGLEPWRGHLTLPASP